jgi:hypothetical protein
MHSSLASQLPTHENHKLTPTLGRFEVAQLGSAPVQSLLSKTVPGSNITFFATTKHSVQRLPKLLELGENHQTNGSLFC